MSNFHLLRVNGENYILYRHPSDDEMYIYGERATLGRSGSGLAVDLYNAETYIEELVDPHGHGHPNDFTSREAEACAECATEREANEKA